jgi:hypothetical protein
MTGIEILKKVNCHEASLVLLASGNDAFYLEVVNKTLQLNPQLEMWVSLNNIGLTVKIDLLRKPILHFLYSDLDAAKTIAYHLLQDDTQGR